MSLRPAVRARSRSDPRSVQTRPRSRHGAAFRSVLTAALTAAGLAVSGSASAQTGTSLHEGAWSLEFQVQPGIFGSSNAAGLAAKHMTSDRSAVRLGMLVGVSSSDTRGSDLLNEIAPYDTLHESASLQSYGDTRDVSLFIHLVRYIGVRGRSGLFIEGGPTGRWHSEEFGDTWLYARVMQQQLGDADIWYYGAEAQAGFEWFFTRRLSLSGRYGFSALRNEGKRTLRYVAADVGQGYSRDDFRSTRSNGFSVQTTPSAVALVAYW